MTADASEGIVRFDAFVLDIGDRRLLHDGAPVALAARYFDALALLVRADGGLVTKDRFLTEVWRGVPVTDEALTQCVRTLRRVLGDDAAAPRFIRTVPKHGYRFVAAVRPATATDVVGPFAHPASMTVVAAGAAALGGGVAGLVGGAALGLIVAGPARGGAISLTLVVTAAAILLGAAGGLGIGAGIGVARAWRRDPRWAILGGALGGGLIGGIARLLGLDAFAVLLGGAPDDITGGLEGFALGATIGAGWWLSGQRLRRGTVLAAGLGAGTGAAIAFAGGRLLTGSLAALSARFPQGRLRPDALESLANAVTSAAEGALYCAGVVAAMLLARRVVLSTTDGRAPPVPPA